MFMVLELVGIRTRDEDDEDDDAARVPAALLDIGEEPPPAVDLRLADCGIGEITRFGDDDDPEPAVLGVGFVGDRGFDPELVLLLLLLIRIDTTAIALRTRRRASVD